MTPVVVSAAIDCVMACDVLHFESDSLFFPLLSVIIQNHHQLAPGSYQTQRRGGRVSYTGGTEAAVRDHGLDVLSQVTGAVVSLVNGTPS